ncbi:hypothetical protein QU481_23080, partial [Crenobacter sp. SG2303]
AQTVSLRGHLHDAGTFFWAKLMVVGGHGNTLSGCCTWGWKPPIYYPSRRQSSPAFSLLVDALRYRG